MSCIIPLVPAAAFGQCTVCVDQFSCGNAFDGFFNCAVVVYGGTANCRTWQYGCHVAFPPGGGGGCGGTPTGELETQQVIPCEGLVIGIVAGPVERSAAAQAARGAGFLRPGSAGSRDRAAMMLRALSQHGKLEATSIGLAGAFSAIIHGDDGLEVLTPAGRGIGVQLGAIGDRFELRWKGVSARSGDQAAGRSRLATNEMLVLPIQLDDGWYLMGIEITPVERRPEALTEALEQQSTFTREALSLQIPTSLVLEIRGNESVGSSRP